jgi:hypothetical protein
VASEARAHQVELTDRKENRAGKETEAYQAFHLHGHGSLIARTSRGHKETPLQVNGKRYHQEASLQSPSARTQPNPTSRTRALSQDLARRGHQARWLG